MSRRMYTVGWILVWANTVIAVAAAVTIAVDVAYGWYPLVALSSAAFATSVLWSVVIGMQLRHTTIWEKP